MPAPETNSDFWNLLWKSGLAEGRQLQAYGERLKEDPARPRTPQEFAQRLVRDGLLTLLQAELLLKGRWRGFMLDKYRLMERLGQGGMGTVYLAAHVQMRRLVALKVLPSERLADRAALERFWREARAVAALDHPNLVRAHDAGQDGDRHFLVMEYVDGSSLQDVVAKAGPLPAARALEYLRQAATGLQHAHDHGLIHRDIKPSNLLLDRRGQVKVLDLGLARFSGDTADHLTRDLESDAVLGSVDYISPEQAMDTHSADARSDVYSLGFTGYFLLAGQKPFSEATATQKLVWHQLREPPPLAELRPDVSKEVARVLAKMHAKDPAERYQSAGEVVKALQPLVGPAPPPPPEAEMPRLCRAARGQGVVDQFRPVDPEAAAQEAPPLWGTAPASGPRSAAAGGLAAAPRSQAPPTMRPRRAPAEEAPKRERPPASAWPAKRSAGPNWLRVAVGVVAVGAIVLVAFLFWSGSGSRRSPIASAARAAAPGGVIRPEADGSIVLSARAALLRGSLRYESSGDNIGWWTNADDYLSWEIEAPTAQTFDVVLKWSCEGDGDQTRCDFNIADATLPFLVEGTGAWHTYDSAKLGTLRVAAGKRQAVLRVTHKAKPTAAAMNLRSITLVPVR